MGAALTGTNIYILFYPHTYPHIHLNPSPHLSQPSQYRNVSAILLRRTGPTPAALLLDAGEGTYGQLVRRFGIAGAEEVVRSIRGVWLSHVHADHHIGVRRVLQRRVELLGEEAAREVRGWVGGCGDVGWVWVEWVLQRRVELRLSPCSQTDISTSTNTRIPPHHPQNPCLVIAPPNSLITQHSGIVNYNDIHPHRHSFPRTPAWSSPPAPSATCWAPMRSWRPSRADTWTPLPRNSDRRPYAWVRGGAM